MNASTDISLSQGDIERKFSESHHEDKASITVHEDPFVPNPELEKKCVCDGECD